MHSKLFQKYLSILTVLVIVLSLMPVSALAVENTTILETSSDNSEAVWETIPITTESSSSDKATSVPLVDEVQVRIDAILALYGIHIEMTDSEIANSIIMAEGSVVEYTDIEMATVDEMAEALTDTEFDSLDIALFERFCNIWNQLFTPAPIATTVTVLDGNISITDSVGTGTVSGGEVIITATGGTSTKQTNNITITNNSGKAINLSFDYSVSNANSHTLPAGSGNYSNVLEPGSSYSFSITSNRRKQTVTLTLKNFNIAEVADSSNVTIKVNGNLGSVTASGTTITADTILEGISRTEGVELVATATSGTFLGWVDGVTHNLLSSSTSYTYRPTSNSTVIAAFAGANYDAWFLVGTKYYNDLNEAATAAANGVGTVILVHDGTLPQGNYSIPSGVTLLIPYDSANTLCTTTPVADVTTSMLFFKNANAWVKPTAYRTLKMASGANITISGAMSLSGKSCAYQVSNGCPTGPLSFVDMAAGSNITVNSGAFLYAWGYIIGSGSVTVKNGGTVYEDFQVKDWRGGSAASGMIDKDQRVFPVSQYYVQNVEVPMTLESGASEFCYMSLVASKVFGDTTVPFVGSNGMFRNSGTIIKDYNENTDRLDIKIDGNLTMSNLKLSIELYNMDSSKYVLPITNNMTVKINSGTTTVSQDMCMLPGCEIEISNGATFKLASGISFFTYDTEEWVDQKYVYSACDVSPLAYANKGTPNTRAPLADAKIVVNGTLDVSNGYLYATAGGANITSDGGGCVEIGSNGTAEITYQATQGGSGGTDITFAEIPITPAQLLNSNGGYVKTAEKGAGTYTYINGFWHKGTSCDGGTATCTKKAVCSTCGLQYGDFGDHSFEQGICSVCGQYMRVEITATNIAVNDGLDMWFYVRANNVNAASYKAVVTKHFADDRSPNPIVVTIPSGQWERYIEESTGIEYLRFCFSDISAKEMTDSVEAAIFHIDGTQVSNNYSQTVQNYAITTLKNYKDNISVKAEALKHALVDMLEYGASAQTQFAYNTAVPANVHAELSDFSGYLTTATPNCTNQKNYGNNVAGVTVSATNTLMFTFYFKVADPDGMYAIIEYTPSGETVEKTVRVESKDFYERIAGSLYGVDVKELSIVDGRALMTCTLYNSDGTVVTTATDSIEGYAYRNAGKGKIFMDMMRFVDSAFTYFTAN